MSHWTPDTIGTALDHMGVDLAADETVAIVTIADGAIRHHPLEAVAGEPIPTNCYYSTGAFAAGTTFEGGRGRTADNVTRVLELPFDLDLHTYLGLDDRGEVYAMTNAEVEEAARCLWEDTRQAFADLGLEPHRVDYTGNGIAVFVRVAPHAFGEVPLIRELHAALVTRFNNLFDRDLADPKVKDAGPRIMRIPFGTNRKIDAVTGVIAERTPYMLHRDPDAPEYSAEELRRIAGKTASRPPARAIPRTGQAIPSETLGRIAEALAPSWQSGSRHSVALGVSAMLAKAGVPEEQAEALIGYLADGDEERADRLRAVSSTYGRYRQGAEIEGYFALRAVIDDEALAFVDRQLEEVRAATRSRASLSTAFSSRPVVHDDKGREVNVDEYPEPPIECEYGWFGRYVNLVEPTTEASRGFHLMAGMTVAGAMVGRRIGVRYGGKPKHPNLYTIIVGPTGAARKGTTIDRAVEDVPSAGLADFHTLENLPYKRRNDVGSGPALIASLADHPNMLLTLDEASTLFEIMGRQSETLREKLLTAWDNPRFMEDNVKTNAARVEEPFLSILGATQPGRLEDAITMTDIKSGLANRMLLVFGTGRELRDDPPLLDQVVARRLWHDLTQAINSYPSGTTLELSDDARGVWRDWYHREGEYNRTASEDEADLRQRHGDYIHKFSLLFAVTDRSSRIELCHLEAAITLMSWIWRGIERRFGQWGVDVETQIEELVKQALERDPLVHKRVLRNRVKRRKWNTSKITQVLRAMTDMSDIYIDPNGLVCRGEDYHRLVEKYGSLEEANKHHPREIKAALAS